MTITIPSFEAFQIPEKKWSKAPDFVKWGGENEGDGRAYVHPFSPHVPGDYPSVTRITGLETGNFHRYNTEQAVRWCVDNWSQLGVAPELAVARGMAQGLVHRDERAWVGTQVHNYVQAIREGSWDFPTPETVEQSTMIENYQLWWSTYGAEALFTELTVVNDTYGYAGTLDQINRVVNPVTGEVSTQLADLKGLPLDTKIPTPTGWSTMGELRVGDLVFGADGKPYPVTAKSGVHYKRNYEFKLDSGDAVVSDFDHRWLVRIGKVEGYKNVVMTTEEIKDRVEERKALGKQGDVRIMNAAPIQMPEADLPIDPYVLGAWLGDGTSSKPEITLNNHNKSGIADEIVSRGYPLRETVYPSDPESSGVRYVFTAPDRVENGVGYFTKLLRDNNLINNKHIPARYLRASFRQRLELLQGIMDTDGTRNIARAGEAAISTTDKSFRDQVYELVSSLGIRAYRWENEVSWTYKGVKKVTTSYSLRFRESDYSVFLRREFDAEYDSTNYVSEGARSRRRLVTEVREVDTVPTQCIEVGSPDHTYLFSESFIVTHNTSRSAGYPGHLMQLGALANAEYGMVRVPEGTDGAVQYKLSKSDKEKRFAIKVELPTFDLFSIIHVRAEKPVEVLSYDRQVIDSYFEEFLQYLNIWKIREQRKVKESK